MPSSPIVDELEIRNLLARLALLADNPSTELDDYLDCFTGDALWTMPGSTAQGHAEIREAALERRRTGTGMGGRHIVAMTAVALGAGSDRAETRSYFQFVNTAVSPPVLAVVGHYLDRFQRTESGWKLASREITLG